MLLDSSGRPVLTYVRGLFHSFQLRDLHCGDVNCASGNTVVTTDNLCDLGAGPSLALDAAGNPVISYESEGAGGCESLFLNLLH